jgi:hypothetical protein
LATVAAKRPIKCPLASTTISFSKAMERGKRGNFRERVRVVSLRTAGHGVVVTL